LDNKISISHTYQTRGTFSPTIIVEDNSGKIQLQTSTIRVLTSPAPAPGPAPEPAADPVPDPDKGLIQPRGTLVLDPPQKTFVVQKYKTAVLGISGTIEGAQRGNEVVLTITKPDKSTDERKFLAAKGGVYKTEIWMYDTWQDGNYDISIKHKNAIIGQASFEVTHEKLVSEQRIPQWIKSNAKWWADGTIGDKDFLGGIEYLIRNDILVIEGYQDIEKTMGEAKNVRIASWIKDTAKWWYEGLVSDKEMINAFKFLIENKIIDLTGE